MSTLTQTAPPEIFLCVSDDTYMLDEDFPSWGVTWADNPAQTVTVHYVRADIAKQRAEREAPCQTQCEAKAFSIEIRRLHKSLLNASESLTEAAEDIRYYGQNPHNKEWEADAKVAEYAAAKATAAAMSGVEPARQQYHQSTIDQLTRHA